MPTTPLLDRMHREMATEARAFSAEELGRTYLKLTSGGPLTAILIRNLLRTDPRFAESSPGEWQAQALHEPTLDQGRYLLAWVELLEEGRGARFRLHLKPATADGASEPPPILLDTDLHAWSELRAWLEAEPGVRWATWQPSLLARVVQWMDRTAGWGELEPPPVDLQGWLRICLARGGMPVAEARVVQQLEAGLGHLDLTLVPCAEGAPPFGSLALLLDALLERAGEWRETELRELSGTLLGSRPVPWSRFRFTAAEIDALPESPGIYRFFDREGGLLYVGKAARLARRVGSYFRPLPPERTKREELLAEIERFEFEALPTELDALLHESREIRTRKPRRNVQIAVHAPESLPASLRWPLLFLPPGEDPLRASVLLLESVDRGHLFHLPRDGGPDDSSALGAWLSRRFEPGVDSPSDPHLAGNPHEAPDQPEALGSPDQPEALGSPQAPDANQDSFRPRSLDPEESRLALRFFLAQESACDRIDARSLDSAASVARALLDLARESGRGRLVRPAAT